ncbi:MAG: electron transfer flavoprotein subunit alpha/FixB family protein [Myxococcales bacterium]|nr:electron transfer flavoprotein subunit alpha/FixB family protein [Myxococcales bacterium]MDH5306545.1 electron transfer flavoprotein subunit alpha/FixB family protein [Myxococcales bacterium]MDH5566498.1 electron transfer flavoprotein subunit alpha/FixB family protein [Myxococcales bacterium]
MAVLAVLEHEGGVLGDVAAQVLSFAAAYAAAAGVPLHALVTGPGGDAAAEQAGAFGVTALHVAEHEGLGAYAPQAVGRSVAEQIGRLAPLAAIGAGTERGNEVFAHVGAITELPVAANCIEVTPGDVAQVTRIRWGGSLLEEARLHGAVKLLTLAPHTFESRPAATAALPAVERFTPTLSDADLGVRVVERVRPQSGDGVSLAAAQVVVGGGRGTDSAEGFAPLEELAALLGGAVGCSRAVTMAGWRPHTDQIGQTGTKIAPEIYIACGVSGATQHMAGCKGAKRILAVNKDAEASIMSKADYAVIGDLHAVLPAISAELRKAGVT